jgi:transposase-like protein
VVFLRSLLELQLPVKAIMSDKQRGLMLALAAVFPTVQHERCHVHYFQNVAAPLAEAPSR